MDQSLLDEESASSTRRARAGTDLADLLREVSFCIPAPSRSQRALIEKIGHLSNRLTTERFQLAVLGQFKRGKSTLLNGLLQNAVLPTGVVPVTAIPTFLEAASSFRLCVTYSNGRSENFEADDTDALRELLTPLVTEEANPRNVLDVGRVDVFLPSAFLARGVVLIDTPGVGSTYHHNSATADAVLPECDATLFVVSPDPPITAVELEFLARVRQTVAQLIIVLNKIDTVEPNERKTATSFLRRVLTEQAQLSAETPIFPVSARDALRAMENGSEEALLASGFLEIERHLSQFLATKKETTLKAAIARKASAFAGDLQLETEIALKSLRLPLDDLERRMQTFDEAAKGFQNERRLAADLLAGDRVRILQELEETAERLRAEGRDLLKRELDQDLVEKQRAEEIQERLSVKVVAFFEESLGAVIAQVRERLNSIFSVHQRRANDLMTLVRQTAADLLEIPFEAREGSESFETRRDPFWVTSSRTVTLNPIPAGAFDPLLPIALRRRRIRRRLLEECESVLLRNVENLRWATRQNLEDAFRRFGAELDEQLALSLASTRGAMRTALDRRAEDSETTQPQIVEMEKSLGILQAIREKLTQFDSSHIG